MLPVLFHAGKNIIVTQSLALWINIHQRAMNRKQGDHFRYVVRYDQSVRFARWLKNIAAFLRNPVVFKVIPTPLDHVGMHGPRVAMPLQDSATTHPEQMDVQTGGRVQMQRP